MSGIEYFSTLPPKKCLGDMLLREPAAKFLNAPVLQSTPLFLLAERNPILRRF